MNENAKLSIIVNNEKMNVEPETTLERLLLDMNIDSTTGVAIARNEAIISKREIPTTTVEDGDHIQIFRAIHGG